MSLMERIFTRRLPTPDRALTNLLADIERSPRPPVREERDRINRQREARQSRDANQSGDATDMVAVRFVGLTERGPLPFVPGRVEQITEGMRDPTLPPDLHHAGTPPVRPAVEDDGEWCMRNVGDRFE